MTGKDDAATATTTATTADPEDAPLVTRAKAGDRAAFSRLVERHHRRIFNTSCRMLGDREAAADLTDIAESWTWS